MPTITIEGAPEPAARVTRAEPEAPAPAPEATGPARVVYPFGGGDDPTPPAAPLAQRIGEALADADAPETALRALLDAIGPEIDRMKADAKAATERALDPRRPATEAAALRQAAADLDHEAARLGAARPLIDEALARLDTVEAERLRAYDEAEAEAARVAALICDRYPALARDLLDLLHQTAEATALVVRANRNLPHGAAPLHGPETRVHGVNTTTGRAPDRQPMSLLDAVLPPIDGSASALFPRTGGNGGGLLRGGETAGYAPCGRWPSAGDFDRARFDLNQMIGEKEDAA